MAALLVWFSVGRPSQAGPVTSTADIASTPNWNPREPRQLRLEGVVTLVDQERQLVVLQDGVGAAALHIGTKIGAAAVGRRVRIEAQDCWPQLAALPPYPLSPSGHEFISKVDGLSIRSPSYVTRIRGYVVPPTSGEYRFWIASDDTSELWLGTSDDERSARQVASVTTWTTLQEWNHLPTQKSAAIALEANRRYYLEILHEQRGGEDHVSVAWEGPGIPFQILRGEHLQPFRPRTFAPDDSGLPAHGLLREYWRWWAIDSTATLNRPRPATTPLVAAEPVVTDLGPATAPEARQMKTRQPLTVADAFRWAELEGVVDFVSIRKDRLILEVTDGEARTRVVILQPRPQASQRLVGRHVTVRGVPEPTFGGDGERTIGTFWVQSESQVEVSPEWSDPERHPLTAIAELLEFETVTDRPIRIRGRVTAAADGVLSLTDLGAFYAYTSSDGANWSRLGRPIEIAMGKSVQAGLVVSSRSSESPATAVFDQVSGLPPSPTLTAVGNPIAAGSLRFSQGRYAMTGSGHDVWVSPDQFHFAHAPMTGAGEIVARVNDFGTREEWAKCGLMIRDGVSPDAQFVDVVITGSHGCCLQWRDAGGTPRSVNRDDLRTPLWIKLARRYNVMSVLTAGKSELAPGTIVEAIGYVTRTAEGIVLADATCRTVEGDKPAAIAEPEDRPVVEIARLISAPAPGGEYGQVKVRGVITFLGRVNGQFYFAIQDRSGGAFLPERRVHHAANFKEGQLLEVHANPAWSDSPGLLLGELGIVLGPGTLPVPVRHPAQNALPRRGEASWLEVEGVVRAILPDGSLQVKAERDLFDVAVPTASRDALRSHVHGTLRIRGVIAYPAEGKRLLLVPSLEHIQVVDPPGPSPFQLAASTIGRVTTEVLARPIARRVKINGTVTHVAEGHLYCEDGSGGALVRHTSAADLKPGSNIEAAGYADAADDRSLVLSHAVVRGIAGPAAVEAPTVTAAQLMSGRHGSRLVKVRAVVSRARDTDGFHTLELQLENRIFRATLAQSDASVSALPAGTVVEVTGVCVLETALPEWMRVSASSASFLPIRLVLRSADDVSVLHKPRWWAVKRTLIIASIAVAVLAVALLWIQVLRRRVAQRTRELNAAMEKLRQETNNAATLAERNRLAGEIHDSLEQGFSGLILQLDTTAKLANCPPDVRSGLALARHMVAFSRNEVRHAVWDLQSPILDEADLRAGIERIVAQIAPESLKVTVTVEGETRRLSSAVEHHLLRIAQEGIANTVKHAQARRLEVTLQYGQDEVRLRLQDDGQGFEPEVALNLGGGHFGLRSLRGRAAKIHGEIHVTSSRGAGTTIEVRVPLQVTAI